VVNDTAAESLQLYQMGMDVEQIALRRQLKPTTVYGHLAQAIAAGEAELTEVVGLDEPALKAIRFAFEQNEEGNRIKPVFEALGGEYSYDVLRCVKADMERAG
jgi:ATP-dependent DNA helicase RecQ